MTVAIKRINSPINSITYVFIAEFIFSVHDVMIKWISGTYPVHEIVLIRSCIAILPIVVIVRWRGGFKRLKTRCLAGHVIRSLLMFASYISFYLALSALPIAVCASLFFSSPIFITILSVVFLKEKVAFCSWIAVFAGFSGVIIMLKPGAEVMDPAAFLALLSAFFYAIGSIMTRSLGKTESGLSLLFYLMVVYTIASAVLAFAVSHIAVTGSVHPSMEFFLRAWQVPALDDLFFFLSIGLIASVGIYCLTQAYRLEDPSKVAPFEYVAVPLGAFWGYYLWNDILDLQTMVGILLIMGSGLYIFHGQRSGK